ncbi:uncharacterized protein LOC102808692 [Saccoglossus kowalevskii]|uniref:Uncharacterized protein LOC102808692 n=1 Tax=Saccoglossus kowalevskii TaxID=10224 RepID=A0ABM0MTP3_SACKO|nr:PREDICTED: uncharacterized protein LOC102808692 [Saccoglossus kowalevskii]
MEPKSMNAVIEIVPDFVQNSTTIALTWFEERFLNTRESRFIKEREFVDRATSLSEDLAYQLYTIFSGQNGGSMYFHELIGALYRLSSKGKQKQDVDWFYKLFKNVCGENHEISMKSFRDTIKTSQCAKKLFKILDAHGSGYLSCVDIVSCLRVISL